MAEKEKAAAVAAAGNRPPGRQRRQPSLSKEALCETLEFGTLFYDVVYVFTYRIEIVIDFVVRDS